MKRKAILTLLILLVVTILPILDSVSMANFDLEAQYYKYSDDGNGGIIITKYNNYNGETSLNILSQIDGKKVTGIGDNAFEACSYLQYVTIPEGVTSIGNNAFYYCGNLKNITIPEGVTSIGNNAFHNCISLQSITIPKSVTSIGGSAFYNCKKLSNVELPEGLTSISRFLFGSCESLGSVVIPESVTTIEANAFRSCSRLETINIPKGVTSIGEAAFGNTNLRRIELPESLTSLGSAFYECSKLTSIIIPKNVTQIEQYTFENCTSLRSVTIPEGVRSIGRGAFQGCSSLTNVEIPKGLTSIDKSAFSECSNLSSIIIPRSVTSIENNTFQGCDDLTIYTYRGAYAQTYGNENNIKVVLLEEEHEYGEWTAGEATHKKECQCGDIIEEAHRGGTATCTKKAICEVCGGEYGTLESSNHINTEIRNVVEATKESAGYTGDTYCTDCNTLIKRGEIIPKVEEPTIIISKPFPFIDVKQTDWYYNSVKFVYDRDIILGTTATTFKPNNNLTRGNLVTILWRMEGSPNNINGKEFPDVKSSEYYYTAVKWACSKGIASGHEDGKFKPNTYITREQLAVMLYNYAKYKGKTGKAPTSITQYIDYKKVSSYAKESVEWAVANKIMSGKENETKIAPQGNATRAETSAMIQNYLTYVK